MRERRQGASDDERHDQQKSDTEDKADRKQPRAQHRLQPALFARRRFPDTVEIVLKLDQHRRRADQQHGHPDDRRDHAGALGGGRHQ